MKGVDLNSLDAEAKFNNLLDKLDASSSVPSTGSPRLPIPKKFEVLYAQIKSMLTCLTTLRLRKQVATFARVREVVERETAHSFTQQTLGRALRFVPPDALAPEWREDRRRNLPQQLYLALAPRAQLGTLFERVYDSIVAYVRRFHHKYLAAIGERAPAEVRCWHHSFDLESVPDVAPRELEPPRPREQLDVFAALRPVVEAKAVSAVRSDAAPPPPVPKACENLSSYFAVARLVQERAQKLDALASIAGNREKENVIKLADVLNMAFSSQRKKTLPLADALSYARRNASFESMDSAQLSGVVRELIDKSGGYFSTRTVSGREYLKIEGSRTFQSVRGAIYHSVYNIV